MRAPDFWRRDGPIPRLLSPVSAIWRCAAARRLRAASPARAGVPVVCIGNLVAGGAGKTPVALSVAAVLAARGMTPHFLSRGYGGTDAGPLCVDPDAHDAARVGDEPLLLAAQAPTWVARDRIAGAKAAVDAGADILVMDDGFQDPALHKTVSLVVVDGAYGFGNGRVMPAGPLREPLEAGLARAQAAAIVGEDRAGAARAIGGRVPVLAARFVPVAGADAISGRRVVAFAGIGRPAKFFETLAGMGCEIVEAHAFADHHPYRAEEAMRLVDRAAEAGAIPVTTEKDAVRLPPDARRMVEVLRVTLEWRNTAALARVLAPVLTAKD